MAPTSERPVARLLDGGGADCPSEAVGPVVNHSHQRCERAMIVQLVVTMGKFPTESVVDVPNAVGVVWTEGRLAVAVPHGTPITVPLTGSEKRELLWGLKQS